MKHRNQKLRNRSAHRASRPAGLARRLRVETCEVRRLLAGLPQLVADLNQDTDASGPSQAIQIGDFAYYTADDGIHGRELWKTDGTAENTSLVKDLNDGPASSYPQQMTEHNGKVYFIANDGENGHSVWTTDGTAAGTQLVADVHPTNRGSTGDGLTSFGGLLLFTGDDGVNGTELWVSDGLVGGTTTLIDINPGPEDSRPRNFIESNGVIFFSANDGATGHELWKLWTADGTIDTVQVARVKDINGQGGSVPCCSSDGWSADVGGKLFFRGDDGATGSELWVTDGTEAGTQQVADLDPGGHSYPSNLISVDFGSGEQLLFQTNFGLYKTDPVTLTTTLVSNVNGFDWPCRTTSGFPA